MERAITLGEQELFFVNRIGKGKAILLNAQMDRYAVERQSARGVAQRALAQALLAAVGTTPPLRLGHAAGNSGSPPYVERTTWKMGGLSLHAVHNHRAVAVDLSARLTEGRHIFSLRKGPLGQAETVALQGLRQGHPAFLAAYPYDPGAVTVAPSQAAAHGGDLVTLTLAMANVPEKETAPFAYETRLYDPKGTWVDVIPWSVVGTRGAAQVLLRFAHNDMPGTWSLQVREITTGQVAKAAIQLQTSPGRKLGDE